MMGGTHKHHAQQQQHNMAGCKPQRRSGAKGDPRVPGSITMPHHTATAAPTAATTTTTTTPGIDCTALSGCKFYPHDLRVHEVCWVTPVKVMAQYGVFVRLLEWRQAIAFIHCNELTLPRKGRARRRSNSGAGAGAGASAPAAATTPGSDDPTLSVKLGVPFAACVTGIGRGHPDTHRLFHAGLKAGAAPVAPLPPATTCASPLSRTSSGASTGSCASTASASEHLSVDMSRCAVTEQEAKAACERYEAACELHAVLCDAAPAASMAPHALLQAVAWPLYRAHADPLLTLYAAAGSTAARRAATAIVSAHAHGVPPPLPLVRSRTTGSSTALRRGTSSSSSITTSGTVAGTSTPGALVRQRSVPSTPSSIASSTSLSSIASASASVGVITLSPSTPASTGSSNSTSPAAAAAAAARQAQLQQLARAASRRTVDPARAAQAQVQHWINLFNGLSLHVGAREAVLACARARVAAMDAATAAAGSRSILRITTDDNSTSHSNSHVSTTGGRGRRGAKRARTHRPSHVERMQTLAKALALRHCSARFAASPHLVTAIDIPSFTPTERDARRGTWIQDNLRDKRAKAQAAAAAGGAGGHAGAATLDSCDDDSSDEVPTSGLATAKVEQVGKPRSAEEPAQHEASPQDEAAATAAMAAALSCHARPRRNSGSSTSSTSSSDDDDDEDGEADVTATVLQLEGRRTQMQHVLAGLRRLLVPGSTRRRMTTTVPATSPASAAAAAAAAVATTTTTATGKRVCPATRVNLRKYCPTVTDVANLCDLLRCLPNVTALDLSFSCLGDDAARILAAHLAHSALPLAELNLAHNSIGHQGAAALAAALRTNSTLTKLSLAHNAGAGAAAPQLAACLAAHSAPPSSLVTRRKAKHGAAIATTAAATTGGGCSACVLQVLDLRQTGIDDAGVAALAKALPRARALRHLSLQGNSISGVGIIKLAAALPQATTLQRLNVLYNPIDMRSIEVLTQALEAAPATALMELPWSLPGGWSTADKGVAARLHRLLADNRVRPHSYWG